MTEQRIKAGGSAITVLLAVACVFEAFYALIRRRPRALRKPAGPLRCVVAMALSVMPLVLRGEPLRCRAFILLLLPVVHVVSPRFERWVGVGVSRLVATGDLDVAHVWLAVLGLGGVRQRSWLAYLAALSFLSKAV